jgi:hypothetical protein
MTEFEAFERWPTSLMKDLGLESTWPDNGVGREMGNGHRTSAAIGTSSFVCVIAASSTG